MRVNSSIKAGDIEIEPKRTDEFLKRRPQGTARLDGTAIAAHRARIPEDVASNV